MYSIPEFDNVFFAFLDVNSQGCDFFKEDSSLSSVCLAGNVDSLEDDDSGSDDVLLDSES